MLIQTRTSQLCLRFTSIIFTLTLSKCLFAYFSIEKLLFSSIYQCIHFVFLRDFQILTRTIYRLLLWIVFWMKTNFYGLSQLLEMTILLSHFVFCVKSNLGLKVCIPEFRCVKFEIVEAGRLMQVTSLATSLAICLHISICLVWPHTYLMTAKILIDSFSFISLIPLMHLASCLMLNFLTRSKESVGFKFCTRCLQNPPRLILLSVFCLSW